MTQDWNAKQGLKARWLPTAVAGVVVVAALGLRGRDDVEDAVQNGAFEKPVTLESDKPRYSDIYSYYADNRKDQVVDPDIAVCKIDKDGAPYIFDFAADGVSETGGNNEIVTGPNGESCVWVDQKGRESLVFNVLKF